MVEVHSRHKRKSGARVWSCAWRCCACLTVMAGCCCMRDSGHGGSGRSVSRGTRDRVLASFGVILLLAGISLPPVWPSIQQFILHSELTLTPKSTSFSMWRTTPVPMYIDFFFWNWTNPHEINDPHSTPHFVQMGPYRFTETKEKVNLTWNSNGTITFQQLRRWYFDAEGSNGSLTDNVTTVNVVALTASHVVRDWNYLLQRSVSLALSSTSQRVHITRTAGQFLFEGYNDPLITIAAQVPGLAQVNIPFDKFGWFYMRNGSTGHDGVFNMRTGEGDISRLGELAVWNYSNRTHFYDGACASVHGSAGELWPPGRSPEQPVSLFCPDLCRSLSLQYDGAASVAGLQGLRYVGGQMLLDNGQMDPDNECFCNGECLAGGVVNVTTCRYGAPAFVSFPHFHLADPSYRAAVRGMQPDPDKHSFYITLEPTTGVPMDVAARFQINLLVQRSPYISMLSRIPERLVVPIIWFQQRASITPQLAVPMLLLLQLPQLVHVMAGVLAVSGVLFIVVPVAVRTYRTRRKVDKGAAAALNRELGSAQGKDSAPGSLVGLSMTGVAAGPGGVDQPLLLRQIPAPTAPPQDDGDGTGSLKCKRSAAPHGQNSG